MSEENAAAAGRHHEAVSWRDYYELCKPNVVLLMLLTSVIGMFMAVPGMVPWRVLVFGNLGIALCAASAAAASRSASAARNAPPSMWSLSFVQVSNFCTVNR